MTSLDAAGVAMLVQFLHTHHLIERRTARFRFRKPVEAFMENHDDVRIVGVSDAGILLAGLPLRRPGIFSRLRQYFKKWFTGHTPEPASGDDRKKCPIFDVGRDRQVEFGESTECVRERNSVPHSVNAGNDRLRLAPAPDGAHDEEIRITRVYGGNIYCLRIPVRFFLALLAAERATGGRFYSKTRKDNPA